MEQYCTFKKILFFLRSYQGKFHQYSKNEQSTSTIYFNKRRLSWKEYKWWELALNWFIPCSNKKNVSSLSCLICKYAEHPAPDSTSLIKPCTEHSTRYFILMKIHDDDFRLQTFRVGTMCFPGDETPPVTGGTEAFQRSDLISTTGSPRVKKIVKTEGWEQFMQPRPKWHDLNGG